MLCLYALCCVPALAVIDACLTFSFVIIQCVPVDQCSFLLPLCAACRVVPPLKTTAFMFTLDTNKDPPSLMDVFADVLAPAVQV